MVIAYHSPLQISRWRRYRRKLIHGNLATLKSVEAIMEETDRAIVPVVGDCLEGAGVPGWRTGGCGL